MRFVIDTNNIISAIIREGISRDILFFPFFKFYTPTFALKEIDKHLSLIQKKSNLDENDFNELISLIKSRITFIPAKILTDFSTLAEEIMYSIDPHDVPIIACALAVPNEGIWTEDKHFEKQDKARMWKSIELLDHV